jgi:hypothetical protein
MKLLAGLFAIIFTSVMSGCETKPTSPVPVPAPLPPTPPSNVCSKTSDCGKEGSGAMCFEGKCLIFEIGGDGSRGFDRFNYTEAFNYCMNKAPSSVGWRLPTKRELKYLCRGDADFEDQTTGTCTNVGQTLGADGGLQAFWTSTCWNYLSAESRDSTDVTRCNINAYEYGWLLNFANAESLHEGLGVQRSVRCVRNTK